MLNVLKFGSRDCWIDGTFHIPSFDILNLPLGSVGFGSILQDATRQFPKIRILRRLQKESFSFGGFARKGTEFSKIIVKTELILSRYLIALSYLFYQRFGALYYFACFHSSSRV